MPKTMFEKIWEAHEVRAARAGGRARRCSTSTSTSCTRSPPPRPSRACGSPAARCAGPTARSRPPTTTSPPTRASAPASTRSRDHLSRKQVAALERNCAEFGVPLLRHAQPPPGHRARDRAGAGPLAAGHHDRLRRLAHLHPRRARRAGDADRHLRGRARPRDAVPAAGAGRRRCASPTRASPASASPRRT